MIFRVNNKTGKGLVQFEKHEVKKINKHKVIYLSAEDMMLVLSNMANLASKIIEARPDLNGTTTDSNRVEIDKGNK